MQNSAAKNIHEFFNSIQPADATHQGILHLLKKRPDVLLQIKTLVKICEELPTDDGANVNSFVETESCNRLVHQSLSLKSTISDNSRYGTNIDRFFTPCSISKHSSVKTTSFNSGQESNIVSSLEPSDLSNSQISTVNVSPTLPNIIEPPHVQQLTPIKKFTPKKVMEFILNCKTFVSLDDILNTDVSNKTFVTLDKNMLSMCDWKYKNNSKNKFVSIYVIDKYVAYLVKKQENVNDKIINLSGKGYIST